MIELGLPLAGSTAAPPCGSLPDPQTSPTSNRSQSDSEASPVGHPKAEKSDVRPHGRTGGERRRQDALKRAEQHRFAKADQPRIHIDLTESLRTPLRRPGRRLNLRSRARSAGWALAHTETWCRPQSPIDHPLGSFGVAASLDVDIPESLFYLLYVLCRQLQVDRTQVLFQALELGRAGDRYDPGLPSKQP